MSEYNIATLLDLLECKYDIFKLSLSVTQVSVELGKNISTFYFKHNHWVFNTLLYLYIWLWLYCLYDQAQVTESVGFRVDSHQVVYILLIYDSIAHGDLLFQ